MIERLTVAVWWTSPPSLELPHHHPLLRRWNGRCLWTNRHGAIFFKSGTWLATSSPTLCGRSLFSKPPLENLRYARTRAEHVLLLPPHTPHSFGLRSLVCVCVLAARRVVFNPPGGHYYVVQFRFYSSSSSCGWRRFELQTTAESCPRT